MMHEHPEIVAAAAVVVCVLIYYNICYTEISYWIGMLKIKTELSPFLSTNMCSIKCYHNGRCHQLYRA